MKLRRLTAMVLALCLLLALNISAGAETAVLNSWTAENAYVYMNERTGTLAVQDKSTGLYTLKSADGTALTNLPYIKMDVEYTLFEVAAEPGLNVLGFIDSTGKEMVPMQYGDVIYISDRWQMGVTLTAATADNYDYKSFDGKNFYLIAGYDVYYMGTKVGTLDRLAYRNAYAWGAYLYVNDTEKNYTYYDSTMTASAYVPSFASSVEYDETNRGIFHKGSGQQVGVPGCTLTSDDVEEDMFLIDGRFVDLQGNIVFAADAKYQMYSDFKGDYARVRMSNGKYGLVDRTGREVMACEYDDIGYSEEYFEGGYQIAVKDGKVGFVNPNGEVSCEFKYSENSVKSVYRSPLTHLADLDGTFIVLSGAAGELEQRFIEVDISNLSSPLFAGMPEQDKVGVYDLYGQEVIAADGLYDDVYDIQISADGSVICGYDIDRTYRIYQVISVPTEAPASVPAEAQTEQPAASGALMGNNSSESAQTEQPAEFENWTCTCGSVNSGKFCPECGTARPTEVKCAKCGYLPEGGKAPKFCPECGNAF